MIDSRQIFAACSIAIAFCYFFICPGNYGPISYLLDGILYGDLARTPSPLTKRVMKSFNVAVDIAL